MQRLEVSGAVRPQYGLLGIIGLSRNPNSHILNDKKIIFAVYFLAWHDSTPDHKQTAPVS
jgi:hypothetical protein